MAKDITCLDLVDEFDEILQKIASRGELGDVTSTNVVVNNFAVDEPHFTSNLVINTPELSVLAAILERLFEIKWDGLKEDITIFELGLDSIDAVKLVSALRKESWIISFSDLMRQPSVITISQRMKFLGKELENEAIERQKSKFESLLAKENKFLNQLSKDERAAISAVNPLTPIQNGLVIETYTSENNSYINHQICELDRNVDIEQIKAAWNSVIQNNEILRTRIEKGEDEYLQITSDSSPNAWVTEFRSEAKTWEDLFSDWKGYQCKSINIFKAPPIHINISQISDRFYILLSIAHVLYDGWSLNLLFSDLHKAYHGLKLIERPSIKTALSHINQQNQANIADFYKQKFDNAKASMVSGSKECEVSENLSFSNLEFSPNLSAKLLKEFCQKYGITLQILCQTAWVLCLSNLLQSLDVSFASIFLGRDSALLVESMIPLMNIVPSRVLVHGSNIDMLQYVQATFNELQGFQQPSLRDVQKYTGKQLRNLYNSLFLFQGGNPDFVNMQRLWVEKAVDFKTEVEEVGSDDAIKWTIISDDQSFSRKNVDTIKAEISRIMQELIYQPQKQSRLSANVDENSVQDSLTESDDENHSKGEWTDIERKIAVAVSRISNLEIQNLERNQSLYHLGIDSIAAISLAKELKTLGVHITPLELLKAETIKNVAQVTTRKSAQHVKNKKNLESFTKRIALDDELHEVHSLVKTGQSAYAHFRPLTPGQQTFWDLSSSSGNLLFMPLFAFMVDMKIDINELENAIALLCERHPVLRSDYVQGSTKKSLYSLQQIKSRPNFDFDHKNISDDLLDEEILAIAKQQSESYKSDNLLRILLLTNSTRSFIFIRMHHMLYDAVSLSLYLYDLQNLYQGKQTETIASEPSFDIYCDRLLGINRNSALHFWRDYLTCHQPSQKKFAKAATQTMQRQVATLSTDPTKLEEELRKSQIAPFCYFIAAFAKVYIKLVDKNSKDVVFGLYYSNRHVMEGLDITDFPTINIIPLRVVNAQGKSLEEIAQKVQDDVNEFNKHDGCTELSLKEIEEASGVKIDTFLNFLRPIELNHTAPSNGETKLVFQPLYESEGLSTYSRSVEELSPTTNPASLLDVECVWRNSSVTLGLSSFNNVSKDILDEIVNEMKHHYTLN